MSTRSRAGYRLQTMCRVGDVDGYRRRGGADGSSRLPRRQNNRSLRLLLLHSFCHWWRAAACTSKKRSRRMTSSRIARKLWMISRTSEVRLGRTGAAPLPGNEPRINLQPVCHDQKLARGQPAAALLDSPDLLCAEIKGAAELAWVTESARRTSPNARPYMFVDRIRNSSSPTFHSPLPPLPRLTCAHPPTGRTRREP